MDCSWSNISDSSSGMQLTIFSLIIPASLIETLIITKPIIIAANANPYRILVPLSIPWLLCPIDDNFLLNLLLLPIKWAAQMNTINTHMLSKDFRDPS